MIGNEKKSEEQVLINRSKSEFDMMGGKYITPHVIIYQIITSTTFLSSEQSITMHQCF